jgi:regulatory protein
MKIDKIKKSGKKYKIILDNNNIITTYDDVIINNGLLYHKEVDPKLLNEINKETSYYDIYYKCVNYITKKLRSEKEINEYIDSFNVSDVDKLNTINKLKEIGLINDLNFTKAYISDKVNLSLDGPNKIRKSLYQHNITDDIINEQLNKIPYELLENKVNKIIHKKIKNTKYTGYVLKQKVVNDLINLGYNKSLVLSIYENINLDDSTLLKKEYDKLYKKLSLKYSDKELNNKLKTKLYQKGFSMDEINNILND